MGIDEINDWLAGPRSYPEGIDLFHRYCGEPDGILAILFKGPANSFVIGKLTDLLKEHCEKFANQAEAIAPEAPKQLPKKIKLKEPKGAAEPEPEPEQEEIYAPVIAPNARHQIGFVKGYPPHLVELDRITLIHLRERDELRGQMRMLPEGEDLRLVATSIVLLAREIAQNFTELDYWVRHGKMMPGTGPLSEKQKYAQMMKALKTHKPYISKYEKSEDPDKRAEALKRKQELEEIDLFINTYGND